MQREHDELHHAALAAKAQLVTAQAQVRRQGAIYSTWQTVSCPFSQSYGMCIGSKCHVEVQLSAAVPCLYVEAAGVPATSLQEAQ